MSAGDRGATARTVAVVGLGVMGGSLARALAADGRPPVGWSPDPSERDAALEAAVVAEAPDTLAAAVADARLVVLAAPLGAVCTLLPTVRDDAPGDAVLTDVASLKAPVLDAARAAGVADRWVGSHPMVGSERSGFGASSAGLYRDAPVWLVRGDARPAAMEVVRGVWTTLGARPREVDAESHDLRMGRVSHLPQLASNALAHVLAGAGVEAAELGPGGRDATRLAASSPEMWLDLLAHAPPNVPAGLRELADAARELADLVERADRQGLASWMRADRSWRRGDSTPEAP